MVELGVGNTLQNEAQTLLGREGGRKECVGGEAERREAGGGGEILGTFSPSSCCTPWGGGSQARAKVNTRAFPERSEPDEQR
jgi:hypothetical protein